MRINLLWVLCVLCVLSACGLRHKKVDAPAPSRECLRSIVVLRSTDDTLRAYERIGSASISCNGDCEDLFKARACALHADAVVLRPPRAHPGGRGAVAEPGMPAPPTESRVGQRDEFGEVITGWQPPRNVQDGVFLRWTE